MPRTLSESEISAFRNKLCETAEHLFAEYGIDGFTMRRLATALGVSAMTPYRYYRNKSDLLTAVRTHAFQLLANDLQQTASRENADQPLQTDALCRAYIHFTREHTDQYTLMFNFREPSEKLPETICQAYQLCLKSISDALQADTETKSVELPLKKIAFAYWSMLHGAVAISQMLGKSHSVDLEDLVLKASHSFLFGSQPQAADRITVQTRYGTPVRHHQEDSETV